MRQFSKHIIFLFFFGCLFTQTLSAQGFKIPEVPKEQTSVYDYIGLLSGAEKATLENKLIRYADTTSTQIVVAIINSTEGENIAYLAANWGEKWGIGGSKENDNGVFILLAKEDRKITIATGEGTEHLLTDYTSRQIIEYDIVPYFKNGDYYAGLNSGTNAIFKVMNGEYKGTRQQTQGFDPSFLIFLIILIIFFILISRGNRGGRRNYRNADSRDILETIILSNAGRGGFGGGGIFGGGSSGGFGGGGFGGGFGGGGFGGGGATGGW